MSSAISSIGGGYTPQVVSGASRRQGPSQMMSQLFQKIDTNGTGSITKSQFEAAFQQMNPPPGLKAMGADAIFNKLDPNGTGSVSKQDFVNGMKSILSQLRAQREAAHNANAANGNQTTSPAATLSSGLQSLEQALGNSATNQGTGSIVNTSA